MKTAASIRYGGMLIDSEDCNYESFKHLGLLCPICKQSVFLVKEKTRSATDRKNKNGSISAVKAATIGSYFAHHPETDKATINNCELKSSQITASTKILTSAIARDQRQKKLKAHLWRMLQASPRGSRMDEEAEIVRVLWRKAYVYSSKKADFALQQLINYLLNKIKLISDKVCNELIEDVMQDLSKMFGDAAKNKHELITIIDEETLRFCHDWSNAIDLLMHKKICLEVIDFIRTKKQKDMIETMILAAIFNVVRQDVMREHSKHDVESDFEIYSSLLTQSIRKLVGCSSDTLSNFASRAIVMWLETIVAAPWANQFELLEQKALAGARK